MKRLFLLLLIASSVNTFAQTSKDTIITTLDYWHKKCEEGGAQYYRVAFKEGNWWHVQDIYAATQRLYQDGMYSDDSMTVQEGMFYTYHTNGRIQSKVRYLKGKMEGVRKEYDTTGRLIDSAIYSKGIPKKAHYKWDSEGHLIFKGTYDEEGYGVGQEYEYFADGKVSSFGITSVEAKKDSIWTYYYPNTGIISAQDIYDKGSKGGRICFDEKGNQYEGTCEDAPAQPVEKQETISRRFGDRYGSMKESNYKFNDQTGSTAGTFDINYRFKKGTYIVFKVYVDEKGNMTNVEVVHKVHPKVDDMIKDIFLGITKFKPARKNNYTIKSSFEQSFPLSGF
jgi:antitoxin component YwqK of YwqJK toxin-antitoxin module